jgi:hypothetical protein
MPKISRFLNGEWISADYSGKVVKSNERVSWSGSYTDYRGNKHKRSLEVSDSKVKIIDEVETSESSVLHLHLPIETSENQVSKHGNLVNFSFDGGSLEITGAKGVTSKVASNSLYYMQKQDHCLISAELADAKIITELNFN